MTRIKILFVTPQLPYPAVSGGSIKSAKVIEHLITQHDIALGCLLKNSTENINLDKFKDHFPQLAIFTTYLSIGRTLTALLNSYMKALPLTIYRNYSLEFKNKVDAIADDYEVIFVDHYLMFQYIPKSYTGRVVMHLHNAEFVMWSRYAKLVNNPLKKLLLAIESYRIKHYELKMLAQVSIALAAPNDKEALVTAGADPTQFIDTFHLGEAQNLTRENLIYEKTSLSILYIGTLSWEANSDGLIWFLKHSWPLVKAKQPNVTFTIAGSCPPQLRDTLLKLEPNLNLLGFVEDLEVLYQTHRVFICPLRFGSGIKVKVINSLYRGLPTVMTPIAAEGLALNNRQHAYITHDAADFASYVVTLLTNKNQWLLFNNESRSLMLQDYTWDKVLKNIDISLTEA